LIRKNSTVKEVLLWHHPLGEAVNMAATLFPRWHLPCLVPFIRENRSNQE